MEASEASAAPSRLGMRGTVLVGATLFSMFFGAGNLILPPLLGVQAASSTVPAMIGFFVTGVGLPVLGIVAVALAGTVRELADRVHPVFSRVFVAAVYLAIGPCLAIPRTSSTAFEMLVPLLPEGVSVEVVRLAFSIAFFAVAYASRPPHPPSGAHHGPRAHSADRRGRRLVDRRARVGSRAPGRRRVRAV